jgi:hypothetical protein
MKNRQNTPDLEKCAVLLMRALEFAERGGFWANRGIEAPPPALSKRALVLAFGEGAKQAVTG